MRMSVWGLETPPFGMIPPFGMMKQKLPTQPQLIKWGSSIT